MRIVPVSYFGARLNNAKNETVSFEKKPTTKNPIIKKPTSYYMSSRPQQTQAPALRYGGIEIREPNSSSVMSVLRDKDDRFAHDFLYSAVYAEYFPWGGEPVRKHVSYLFSENNGRSTNTEIESLLDRATNVGSAASSAYLIYWFEKCISEDSKGKFIDKKNKLIEQARKDLNKPYWSPSGIAYQSDKRGSGARY